jgi:hypothetical protein
VSPWGEKCDAGQKKARVASKAGTTRAINRRYCAAADEPSGIEKLAMMPTP